MEERITSYLTLNQVAKSAMNERNEQGIVNYERYLQILIEGFSEIRIFNLNSVEVKYLSVDPDTKIAALPSDFISMTKIGVNICNQIWTLTLNDNITPRRPETICPETFDECANCTDISSFGGYYFAPFWYNGQFISTMYGIGGGINSAYYKIDESNNRILFQGIIPNNEVILEYVSSGVTAGGSPINRKAAPALKAYLHWKLSEYDNRIPMNEKIRKEDLYNKELYSLSRLEGSFTVDEFLDGQYASYSQTLKR